MPSVLYELRTFLSVYPFPGPGRLFSLFSFSFWLLLVVGSNNNGLELLRWLAQIYIAPGGKDPQRDILPRITAKSIHDIG